MIQRNLPYNALLEMNRQDSAEAYLVFMEITHPSLAEVIRVVSDPEDFILEGNLYIGFQFNITLLSDDDSPTKSQLSIQNVDRRIGDTLRNVVDPARLSIYLLALSEFDNAEPRASVVDPAYIYRAQSLYLIDVQATPLEISGQLVSWNYGQEPFPGIYTTQDRYPGLFR